MSVLNSDDKIMHTLALQGGYIPFARYYFDWEPLPNQFVAHYAPQPNVIHLGGVGSGKTMGQGMSFLTSCMTTPYYLALNTSISSFQAKLMFDKLQPYINHPRVERFISDVRNRPYPEILFWKESKFACMTAGHLATLIRGSEWDEINGDEFFLISLTIRTTFSKAKRMHDDSFYMLGRACLDYLGHQFCR